ncbi:MAG: DUF4442 domain-containing protein [Sphingomicrobium sp.]
MTTYETIRTGFGSAVPFAEHTGIEVIEVGAGFGVAQLKDASQVRNHIGSVHAGAVFTLGETASGVAMLGAFADQVASIRPVTVEVTVSYLKMARGTLTATARTVVPAEQLQSDLAGHGRATFDITVDISNDSAVTVAQLIARWVVSMSKSTT